MRLALVCCGLMMLASPALAQRAAPQQPARLQGTPGRSVQAATPAAPAAPRPSATRAAPTTSPAPAAPVVTDSSEALVDQQVGAMQQRLQQEERQLQARLAHFAKMREAAFQKRDDRALQQIEQLERQAVQAYEARVNQIIAGANRTSNPQAQPQQRAPSPQQQMRTQPRQTQKSRSSWSLWPFRF